MKMTSLWQKLTSKWWKKSVQTVEDVIDTTEKTLSSAAISAGQLVEGTAKAAVDITNQAVDVAIDYTDKAVDVVGSAAKTTVDVAIDCTDKAVDTVGDTAKAVENTAKAAVDMTGQAVDMAVEYSGKAVDAVGDGLDYLKQSMLNTGKFLVDEQYRNEEVFPWIKSIIRDNWDKIKQEVSESEEMMVVLWKYSQGKEISEEENKAAKEQLYDLMRMVPALGIFALPGGAILLPLLARALPWDLMPSSFRSKIEEEYGEEALQQELTSDDKVPVDNNAEIPDDIKKNLEEKAPELLQQDNTSV